MESRKGVIVLLVAIILLSQGLNCMQTSTPSYQVENVTEVSCDFDGLTLCNWDNEENQQLIWNPIEQWNYPDTRLIHVAFVFGKLFQNYPYDTGRLVSPDLQAKPNSVCQLQFRYFMNPLGCWQLSVLQQYRNLWNGDHARTLWSVTRAEDYHLSDPVQITYDCATPRSYRIILEVKLTSGDFGCLGNNVGVRVDDILLTVFTLPTTATTTPTTPKPITAASTTTKTTVKVTPSSVKTPVKSNLTNLILPNATASAGLSNAHKLHVGYIPAIIVAVIVVIASVVVIIYIVRRRRGKGKADPDKSMDWVDRFFRKTRKMQPRLQFLTPTAPEEETGIETYRHISRELPPLPDQPTYINLSININHNSSNNLNNSVNIVSNNSVNMVNSGCHANNDDIDSDYDDDEFSNYSSDNDDEDLRKNTASRSSNKNTTTTITTTRSANNSSNDVVVHKTTSPAPANNASTDSCSITNHESDDNPFEDHTSAQTAHDIYHELDLYSANDNVENATQAETQIDVASLPKVPQTRTATRSPQTFSSLSSASLQLGAVSLKTKSQSLKLPNATINQNGQKESNSAVSYDLTHNNPNRNWQEEESSSWQREEKRPHSCRVTSARSVTFSLPETIKNCTEAAAARKKEHGKVFAMPPCAVQSSAVSNLASYDTGSKNTKKRSRTSSRIFSTFSSLFGREVTSTGSEQQKPRTQKAVSSQLNIRRHTNAESVNPDTENNYEDTDGPFDTENNYEDTDGPFDTKNHSGGVGLPHSNETKPQRDVTPPDANCDDCYESPYACVSDDAEAAYLNDGLRDFHPPRSMLDKERSKPAQRPSEEDLYESFESVSPSPMRQEPVSFPCSNSGDLLIEANGHAGSHYANLNNGALSVYSLAGATESESRIDDDINDDESGENDTSRMAYSNDMYDKFSDVSARIRSREVSAPLRTNGVNKAYDMPRC